jgi:hypothetical protein
MDESNRQLEFLKERGVAAWNQWREDRRQKIDLIKTDLRRTDLRQMDLRGVDFTVTDLRWANLSGAHLADADLNGARLRETLFVDTDLSHTKGLDSCVHSGPSVIDHRTLLRSRGLPLAFLRGCGLPDRLIEYLPSLAGEAFEFYSCFISYSTVDQDFAAQLHAGLQSRGVRCWFAPHDIQGGRKLEDQIDDAIKIYDKLLLILSTGSMSSEWVATEISKARKRERKESRRMLFPISLVPFPAIRDWECFDADTGKDSAREIREYFVPDFSNWKDHDSYRKAFERLVQDLKAR